EFRLPPPRFTGVPYTSPFRSHQCAQLVHILAQQGVGGAELDVAECVRVAGLRFRGVRGAVSCAHARSLAQPCAPALWTPSRRTRSEEHTSELQSRENLVCRLL